MGVARSLCAFASTPVGGVTTGAGGTSCACSRSEVALVSAAASKAIEVSRFVMSTFCLGCCETIGRHAVSETNSILPAEHSLDMCSSPQRRPRGRP